MQAQCNVHTHRVQGAGYRIAMELIDCAEPCVKPVRCEDIGCDPVHGREQKNLWAIEVYGGGHEHIK